MRRRHLWLLGAAALLAAAVWLLSRGEESPQAPPPQVQFPFRATRQDINRAHQRELPPPSEDAHSHRPAGDPVLRALVKGKTALVFEANALRNSPVGELLLDCFRNRGANPVEEVKRDFGLDMTRDLDRVAVTEDGVVLSGHFNGVRWEDMLGNLPESYGDNGLIYPRPRLSQATLPDGGAVPNPETFARWGDDYLLVGKGRAGTEALLSRMDGTESEPALSANQTYGEVYGTFGASELAGFLPPAQSALADQLKNVVQEAEVHVDTRQDVAVVIELKGANEEQLGDLAKALGSSLALWRTAAQLQGQAQMAQFLEYASVSPPTPGSPHARLQLALPMAFLEQQLAWCRPDGGR